MALKDWREKSTLTEKEALISIRHEMYLNKIGEMSRGDLNWIIDDIIGKTKLTPSLKNILKAKDEWNNYGNETTFYKKVRKIFKQKI
jgi:hypothetical protein